MITHDATMRMNSSKVKKIIYKSQARRERGCDGCARTPLPHLPHRFQRPTFLLVKVNVEYCSIENTMRELISLTHPFHKTCLFHGGFVV